MNKEVSTVKEKNWLSLMLHVASWAIFLTLPFLLRNNNGGKPRLPRHMPPPVHLTADNINHLQYEPLVLNLMMIPLFYLNTLYLVPRLLMKRKYWQFIGIQILNLLIINFLIGFLHRHSVPEMPPMRMGITFFIYALIVLFAICYCLIRHNVENERQQKEKENESLRSELTFLRWQISPHFMFNVLNNMVALSRVKSDKLEPMLIRLSTLMRYMVYDNDEKKVSIAKELEYLQSYIDLQSIRVGTEVDIKTDFYVNNNENVMIEPMLLIPFVENAFKHGTGTVAQPFIHVSLGISDSQLLFAVKNRYSSVQHSFDDSHGIGLANVQRRLDLIYEKKYILNVNTSDGLFFVTLQIDLR